jgi:hypothetical protein
VYYFANSRRASRRIIIILRADSMAVFEAWPFAATFVFFPRMRAREPSGSNSNSISSPGPTPRCCRRSFGRVIRPRDRTVIVHMVLTLSGISISNFVVQMYAPAKRSPPRHNSRAITPNGVTPKGVIARLSSPETCIGLNALGKIDRGTDKDTSRYRLADNAQLTPRLKLGRVGLSQF